MLRYTPAEPVTPPLAARTRPIGCLALRQGSADDGVHLSVDVQLRQAATQSVIGHADGDGLDGLGHRNGDFKERLANIGGGDVHALSLLTVAASPTPVSRHTGGLVEGVGGGAKLPRHVQAGLSGQAQGLPPL